MFSIKKLVQIFEEQGVNTVFKNGNFWAFNNSSMYIIYCIYFSMRVFSENFGGNMLIIKDLEYEDAHAEVEEIKVML